MTGVEHNDLDEVVSVTVRKGNGEIIRRHSSDVILLETGFVPLDADGETCDLGISVQEPRPRRAAARKCESVNRNLTRLHLV